ncbi:hypothetical protein BH11BAC3_BH11BAC3_07480 [soil metagenome]
MKALDIKNIDKTNWKKYRFEEISASISERVEPGETDLDIYVGLEHLDAESLHIKRTGVPSDVSGTKLKVYKGDLIFGKRRAYQRKASIAHFDGICSAHAMVLRAKEKVIDPKLFPFFIHSDYFMHRAIDISVGGLSPTINWGTLKNQEFLLPPIDQQAKLSELLWAADDVVEKYKILKENISLNNQIFTFNTYSNPSKDSFIEIELLELVIKKYGIVDGPFGSNLKTIHYKKEGVPIMQSSFVTKGYFRETERLYVDEEKYKEQIRSSVKSYDILMAKIGANYGECAIVPEYYDRAILAGNSLKISPDNNKCNTKYLLYYLKYIKSIGVLEKLVTTTAQPALSIAALKKLKLKVLKDLKLQENVVKRIEHFNSLTRETSNTLRVLNTLQKQLINQIFS